MTMKLLICDDSNMARKQLARCLPDDWQVEVLFAEDGQHGLEQIHQHSPDLMFLDLNMPILDGYETLEEISVQKLDIPVIVVSGDIQPTAQEKVLSLGAMDFIKKPIDRDILKQILLNCGFYHDQQPSVKQKKNKQASQTVEFLGLSSNSILTDDKAFIDACQEVANVAMGQAGDLLARYLDVFINLPIPKVNEIELAELNMAMQFADQDQTVSSVCQGFIGPEIAGEALLLFNDSSFSNIARLLKYQGAVNKNLELELLMDISNIIVGACLKGISEQINVNLSQSHPVVLGQHIKVPNLIEKNVKQWKKTLSIEINYKIKDESINCDLLLLFTEESIEPLRKRLSYLVD
ncbi:MAG: response regulator [Enterobacterales bacterium]|nr:response regulator [Enterobacterales bacterium]